MARQRLSFPWPTELGGGCVDLLEGLDTLEGCTGRAIMGQMMRRAGECLLGSIRDGDGGWKSGDQVEELEDEVEGRLCWCDAMLRCDWDAGWGGIDWGCSGPRWKELGPHGTHTADGETVGLGRWWWVAGGEGGVDKWFRRRVPPKRNLTR
jgi:hypothetical protein